MTSGLVLGDNIFHGDRVWNYLLLTTTLMAELFMLTMLSDTLSSPWGEVDYLVRLEVF
ncbi:MAG: hypothetical protein IPL12_21440 [Bacteroidetes bacterium]|nr:hypothetical protein [Bacteroidota bacterium]